MNEQEELAEIDIPDFVECMREDEQGLPVRVINPVFEIYFEPQFGLICDFDRIVLDANGLWHWEHEEYYPEYAAGQMWALDYPENMTWHYNSPPSWFTGQIEDDDPIYGKIVNSLSWYEYFSSFQELLEDNELSFPPIVSSGVSMLAGIRKEHVMLRTYVNPATKFAPSGSRPAKVKVKPPKGFKHWLTFGITEEHPEVQVFYPIRPSGEIQVRVHHEGNVHYLTWRHGQGGLYARLKRFISETLIDERNRTKSFFDSAFEQAAQIEQAFRIKKGIV